jgi:hypothetical protein
MEEADQDTGRSPIVSCGLSGSEYRRSDQRLGLLDLFFVINLYPANVTDSLLAGKEFSCSRVAEKLLKTANGNASSNSRAELFSFFSVTPGQGRSRNG